MVARAPEEASPVRRLLGYRAERIVGSRVPS
jgi:hypothetical protein